MIKLLSSVRIAVVSLFLLFILTFWGTIAQVHQGLYVAQERFFASFFFLAGGWFPFPGAQLVLWVLFINLLCASVVYFSKYKKWTAVGLKITHVGLLIYFASAFFIFHLSKESNIHLMEGQKTNVSTSYTEWEIAYWIGDGKNRQIIALDTKNFKPGFQIPFEDPNFKLSVKQFYLNSDVYTSGSNTRSSKIISIGNISLVTPRPIDKEREKNIAGGVFDLNVAGKSSTLLLFGTVDQATPVVINGKKYNFILRHKTFPLPLTLNLDSFKAEFHPGTNTAKSYESLVTITTGDLKRQVRIYMNNPLRYKDYTLYQSSYSTDENGRQYSTLAVVRNSAQILPYIACLMVFIGMSLHFLIQAFLTQRKI